MNKAFVNVKLNTHRVNKEHNYLNSTKANINRMNDTIETQNLRIIKYTKKQMEKEGTFRPVINKSFNEKIFNSQGEYKKYLED